MWNVTSTAVTTYLQMETNCFTSIHNSTVYAVHVVFKEIYLQTPSVCYAKFYTHHGEKISRMVLKESSTFEGHLQARKSQQ